MSRLNLENSCSRDTWEDALLRVLTFHDPNLSGVGAGFFFIFFRRVDFSFFDKKAKISKKF